MASAVVRCTGTKKRNEAAAWLIVGEVLAVVHLFSGPTPPSALRPGLCRASLPGFGPGSPCNISNPLKLGTPRVILDIYANELTKRGNKANEEIMRRHASTEWVGMRASPPAPVGESVQVCMCMCVFCACAGVTVCGEKEKKRRGQEKRRQTCRPRELRKTSVSAPFSDP